tara:strand:+ start:2660 stop:2905 length:246 start_codon:yes stop_codon:yes gene_type:complete
MWGFEDWEVIVLMIGGTIMICAIGFGIYICKTDPRYNNPLNEDLLKNNNERTMFKTISPSDRYLSNSNEEIKESTSSDLEF